MLDNLLAVRPALSAALATAVPGITIPLYTGQLLPTNVTVTLPYGWLRESATSPLVPDVEAYEDIVYLDLYGRSSAEVQRMESATLFLDDYNPAPFGNAFRVHWKVQSKNIIAESEGAVHQTNLYAVRYGDLRKVLN